MQYTALGSTGLTVSVAGLGCGGNSRLGQADGKSEAESVALVRQAIDLGVNLLDTAAVYGTEAIVGKAIRGLPRESLVISTKALIKRRDAYLSGEDIVAGLEQSLRKLGVECIDVFHLHAVAPCAYEYALNELAPALLRERDKGKLRHLGITETSPNDPGQAMLQRALQDECWEVVMLAFHMLHQKARQRLFPLTRSRGVGTLLMFVVRSIFSRPGRLQAVVRELAKAGRLPADVAERDEPLGFLVHPNGADSIIDAAYRFARHEPGSDVVLFGTGDRAHLKTNVESILKPPLPSDDVRKLYELFGHLEGVGLDLPLPRSSPGGSGP